MKTTAYLQIIPRFNRSGNLMGMVAKKVSAKHPTEPLAGAVTLKLVIEVPDKAFKPILVGINVPEHVIEVQPSVTFEKQPGEVGRG